MKQAWGKQYKQLRQPVSIRDVGSWINDPLISNLTSKDTHWVHDQRPESCHHKGNKFLFPSPPSSLSYFIFHTTQCNYISALLKPEQQRLVLTHPSDGCWSQPPADASRHLAAWSAQPILYNSRNAVMVTLGVPCPVKWYCLPGDLKDAKDCQGHCTSRVRFSFYLTQLCFCDCTVHYNNSTFCNLILMNESYLEIRVNLL